MSSNSYADGGGRPATPAPLCLDAATFKLANSPAAELSPEQVGDNLFFVAASPAMVQMRREMERVAQVDVPVLCLGESGTGKEVIAQLLHKLSVRREQTFLKVNCAALPPDLLESELFGYEAGAFTGAVRSKAGKFELCNKGTIFLDEIAEMTPALQAKLLHVVQDREFSRLGGCSRIKVDVRVVAATNVDIEEAIRAKQFRLDLFYRLSGFVFHLPPLRERPEDIPVLLRHYLDHFAARFGVHCPPLSRAMLDCALHYAWPGNVRELENVAKRYLVLGDEELIIRELGHAPCREDGADLGTGSNLKTSLERARRGIEIDAIRRALREANWNRKEAARRLRLSYGAMLYKMRRYGLERELREASH